MTCQNSYHPYGKLVTIQQWLLSFLLCNPAWSVHRLWDNNYMCIDGAFQGSQSGIHLIWLKQIISDWVQFKNFPEAIPGKPGSQTSCHWTDVGLENLRMSKDLHFWMTHRELTRCLALNMHFINVCWMNKWCTLPKFVLLQMKNLNSVEEEILMKQKLRQERGKRARQMKENMLLATTLLFSSSLSSFLCMSLNLSYSPLLLCSSN